MSERSEPKQVCRRNALAFIGYAAAFGLVASSAVLTVSQAEAQTTTAPTTRATPPADAAKSGTERRQEGRTRRQKGGPTSERNVGRPYSVPPVGYRTPRAGRASAQAATPSPTLVYSPDPRRAGNIQRPGTISGGPFYSIGGPRNSKTLILKGFSR